MITLEQAIEIATIAHKGQWRNARDMSSEERQDTELIQTLDELDDHISDSLVIQVEEGYKYNGYKFIWDQTIEQWLIREPYITHPLAVMKMMHTEQEKIVAVLHDVIEDCERYGLGKVADHSRFYLITKHNRYKEEIDIPELVYIYLHRLTKKPNQPYLEYIQNLAKEKLTTKVKLADIFHNLSCNPSNHAKEKYLKAIPILLKSI